MPFLYERCHPFCAIFRGLEQQGQIGLEAECLPKRHLHATPDGFLCQLRRVRSPGGYYGSKAQRLGERVFGKGENLSGLAPRYCVEAIQLRLRGCDRDIESIVEGIEAVVTVAGKGEHRRFSPFQCRTDSPVVPGAVEFGDSGRIDEQTPGAIVVEDDVEFLKPGAWLGYCPQPDDGDAVAEFVGEHGPMVQRVAVSPVTPHDRAAMSQFSDSVPVNPVKPNELHDQAAMPARPALPRQDFVKVWAPFIIGTVLALGSVALAFQTRASWDSHRDWVVPVTVPILVIGGLAMGYLAAGMRLKALAVPIVLLAVALLFTLLNILRGNSVEGSDGLRDALSIMTGVLLGATILWLIVAFAWTEYRNPIEPPAAEM